MREVEYSDKHSKKEGQKNKSRRSIIPKLIDKVKEDVRSVLTIGAIVLTSITASLIATSPNPVYGLEPITLPEGTRVLGQEVISYIAGPDSIENYNRDTLALFYQDSTGEIHPFDQEGFVVVEGGDTLKTLWRSDTFWTDPPDTEEYKIIEVYGAKVLPEERGYIGDPNSAVSNDGGVHVFWYINPEDSLFKVIKTSVYIRGPPIVQYNYWRLDSTAYTSESNVSSTEYLNVYIVPPTDTFLISSLSIREGRHIPKLIEGEVYPNPTNSRVKIKTDGKIQRGYILDQTGKIVREFKEKEIDLSKLNSGRYYIVWVKEDKYYVSEITLVK